MKTLLEITLCIRLGYLRQCHKTANDYFLKRKLERKIYNIESVLIDIDVLTENQRTKQ